MGALEWRDRSYRKLSLLLLLHACISSTSKIVSCADRTYPDGESTSTFHACDTLADHKRNSVTAMSAQILFVFWQFRVNETVGELRKRLFIAEDVELVKLLLNCTDMYQTHYAWCVIVSSHDRDCELYSIVPPRLFALLKPVCIHGCTSEYCCLASSTLPLWYFSTLCTYCWSNYASCGHAFRMQIVNCKLHDTCIYADAFLISLFLSSSLCLNQCHRFWSLDITTTDILLSWMQSEDNLTSNCSWWWDSQ